MRLSWHHDENNHQGDDRDQGGRYRQNPSTHEPTPTSLNGQSQHDEGRELHER